MSVADSRRPRAPPAPRSVAGWLLASALPAARRLWPCRWCLGTGAYLAARFRLGYDDQAHQCLPPHRWFLIDRHDRAVRRGSLIAFAALGSQMGP